MYFVKQDYNKLRKSVPVSKIVHEFQQSGLQCVKLDDGLYTDKIMGERSFSNHLHRHKLTHIKMKVQDGSLYMINTLIRG